LCTHTGNLFFPFENDAYTFHSKFLDFTPWSDYSFFRSFVTLPFLNREPRAIEVVQVILESVLLRREKSMKDSDGRPIVELPGKEARVLRRYAPLNTTYQMTHIAQVVVETLQFSPLERSIYDSLFRVAKSSFDDLNAKGLVGKRYTHILAMLMRFGAMLIMHTRGFVH
jgi:DNA repair protein RAD5